jgi:xylulokinase
LVAIGGGARNRAVVQLKADVLGIPIAIAAVTEAGCMGAAMLAKAADTGEDVRHIAQRWVRLADVCRPDPVNAGIYGERFESYKRLYPALRSLM